MTTLETKSFRIHKICEALNHSKIRTGMDLQTHLEKVVQQICSTSSVFKKYEPAVCYRIFKNGVKKYQEITETKISLSHNLKLYFCDLIRSRAQSHAYCPVDDLDRIARNYDRFGSALQKIYETNERLTKMLEPLEFTVIPHVILGLGDAGTTLWLEKYSQYHHQETSEVMMIGQTCGNMKNGYALSQTHNVLERAEAPYNPKDYTSKESYENNSYVNGKHLFLSNLVNLSKTKAPILLNTTVTAIEVRDHFPNEWHCPEQKYRLKIQISNGREKLSYVNELDVATGLGYAKKDFLKDHIDAEIHAKLNPFTIMDADHYIFAYSEDQNRLKKRSIVIFGGGDTAAASYRKAFFGKDFCLKDYSKANQKNDVLWVSNHGFKRAARGKMPKTALEHARNTGGLWEAQLGRIEADTKKLYVHLYKDEHWVKIECDQFIFSIGQDSEERSKLFEQMKPNIVLSRNGMKTVDDHVHFLGAAAQTMGGRPYLEQMSQWFDQNRICEDSASPAVISTSRAMIKLHAIEKGASLRSINVSMDDLTLVRQFLTNKETVENFINDLMVYRQRSESGISRQKLRELIFLHKLDDVLFIKGQNLLVQS